MDRSLRLAAATVAVLLLTASPALANCDELQGRAAPRQDLALEVVGLVNAHRASIGVAPLTVSPSLMRSALWKSEHMFIQNYFDHDDPAPPVARTFSDRLAACGYPAGRRSAENIAYGSQTPAEVMQQWLDSPGHRANIENPGFATIGVGAGGPSRHWTQNFGEATSEPGNPAPTAVMDVLQMDEDQTDGMLVIDNDQDTPGDWPHVIAVSEGGVATLDGRGVMVTPPPDFNGVINLTATVADVMGQASTAPLVVRVQPVNDVPVAVDDRARLRRRARTLSIPALRNDRDVDGDRLSVRFVQRPRYGRVRERFGRIIYTPRRGRWPGGDSLKYRLLDRQPLTSGVATVRITGARRR